VLSEGSFTGSDAPSELLSEKGLASGMRHAQGQIGSLTVIPPFPAG